MDLPKISAVDLPSSPSMTLPIEPMPRIGVVTGYDYSQPILNNFGICKVTIDNTQNDMPVYVRIWSLDYYMPVRAFYISEGDSFTMSDFSPGAYEVRYIELYDNELPPKGAKSEPFQLEQVETYSGTRYSQYSLTLYRVTGGNTQTIAISADEV